MKRSLTHRFWKSIPFHGVPPKLSALEASSQPFKFHNTCEFLQRRDLYFELMHGEAVTFSSHQRHRSTHSCHEQSCIPFRFSLPFKFNLILRNRLLTKSSSKRNAKVGQLVLYDSSTAFKGFQTVLVRIAFLLQGSVINLAFALLAQVFYWFVHACFEFWVDRSG